MYDYLLKRGVIFVWVAVVVMGIALFITREDEVKYEASAKVLVDQPQLVGQPAGASNPAKIQQLIPTYAQSIMTLYMADKVAFKLPDYSPEDIRAVLTAKSIEKTQILVITAESTGPEKSMEIAQMAARVFVDDIEKQQYDDKVKSENSLRLKILEPANTYKTNDPHRPRTAFLTAFAAIIVSAGAMLVYENGRRA